MPEWTPHTHALRGQRVVQNEMGEGEGLVLQGTGLQAMLGMEAFI